MGTKSGVNHQQNHQQTISNGIYRSLLKNQTLMLLWSGKAISIIGDAFFDLAVMWVVYEQSQSILQSATVGIIIHLSTAFFSPIAGALADRWDRKSILWITNVLSAIVIGFVTLFIFLFDYLPLPIALVSILFLNAFGTFLNPAEASIMPEIINKEHFIGANGIFQAISQISSLLGRAIGGFVIAGIGAGWALTGDALSFLIVAICISFARIPKRTANFTKGKLSLWRDIKDGWSHIKSHRVIKTMLLLYLLINAISFMPTLYPALVNHQLNGNATIYGMIQAASFVGGLVGGLVTGFFERKFKVGHLVGGLWVLAGLCNIGIAFSTSILLTMLLLFAQTLFITVSVVSLNAIQMLLIPEEYRGRLFGIIGSLSVIIIPLTTLIAGLLGDIIGVSTLFVIAGFWIIGVSILAFINPHIRNANVN